MNNEVSKLLGLGWGSVETVDDEIGLGHEARCDIGLCNTKEENWKVAGMGLQTHEEKVNKRRGDDRKQTLDQ
jgi:hypothetical protein